MTRILLDKPSGATFVLPHVSSTVSRREGEMNTAKAVTSREAVNSHSPEEGNDEVRIEDDDGNIAFGGPLREIRRNGTQVALHIDSHEQYAKDWIPTSANAEWQNAADYNIVRTYLSAVPQLSFGNIVRQVPDVDIVFHHATTALVVRLMRDISGAQVRYNSDGSVDYAPPGEIGSDRTGTVITPANQNLRNLRPRRKGGDRKKTHLRMIGGAGTSIDVVADSYDSDTDRQRWGRAEFLDVSQVGTLEYIGETLLDQLSTEWLEVRTTATDISPAPVLGDRFTVDYPEMGIDHRALQVVELTERRDIEGTDYEMVLSTRTQGRNFESRKTERRASQSARAGQTRDAGNLSTINLPRTKIPFNDTGDEYVEQVVPIPPKHLMYVWSVSNLPNSPDAHVEIVKANQGPFSSQEVVYDGDGEFHERGSPLAIVDGISYGVQAVSFRVVNETTDTDIESGATATYTLEQVEK